MVAIVRANPGIGAVKHKTDGMANIWAHQLQVVCWQSIDDGGPTSFRSVVAIVGRAVKVTADQ